MAVVNGNPAISFYDSTNGKPTYVRALDAQGNTWGTPVAVDISGSNGWFTSLLVVDGNPAISYYDANHLKYVRATDRSGVAWGTPVGVDISGNVGYYTFLAIVDGNPAISYSDSTNRDLKFARLTGSVWAIETVANAGHSSVGYTPTSLALDVAGNPVISYRSECTDGLGLARFFAGVTGYCCGGVACRHETSAGCAAIPGASYGGDGTDCSVSCVVTSPTVYESVDPSLIVDPTNAVGSPTASPEA